MKDFTSTENQTPLLGVFTSKVIASESSNVIARETWRTNREALEELTGLKSDLIGMPYRAYLDQDEITTVVAMREWAN